MNNLAIAHQLLDVAHSLEKEHANFYRVRAYRRAAQIIRGMDQPIESLLIHAGCKALRELPGIGVSLSSKIETLVRTGEFPIVKEEEEKMLVTT